MPSKPEILHDIERARPDLQHEIAAKYGGLLVDLTCKTRHCGGKLLRQWVETPKVDEPNLAIETRFVQCPKCGVKGNWTIVESPEPNPALIAKAKAEEASEKEKARKDAIAEIDRLVDELFAKRKVLEDAGPKPAEDGPITKDAEPLTEDARPESPA